MAELRPTIESSDGLDISHRLMGRICPTNVRKQSSDFIELNRQTGFILSSIGRSLPRKRIPGDSSRGGYA